MCERMPMYLGVLFVDVWGYKCTCLFRNQSCRGLSNTEPRWNSEHSVFTQNVALWLLAFKTMPGFLMASGDLN